MVAARTEAKKHLYEIEHEGADPVADQQAEREAPSVTDLAERFVAEHLPRLRPSSRKEYEAIIATIILPALKHLKINDLSFSDIDKLHRRATTERGPYRANRTIGVLSKMLSLAIKWGWCTGNAAKGVERNVEQPRHRYLTTNELERLLAALTVHDDRQGANIIKLLLLTGARRNEVQSMRWADIDLEIGVWVKPSSATKQARVHRIPLSGPARLLLADLHAKADKTTAYVFPTRTEIPAGHFNALGNEFFGRPKLRR